MNTQNLALAQLVNKEFITNFMNTRYNPTATELYIFRDQASGLSDTARSALSDFISGNIHLIFNKLANDPSKEIDPITKRMDGLLWGEILTEKLKNNICPTLYREINSDHINDKLYTRFGSPNETGIANFIEYYTETEALLTELKHGADQLKALMANPYLAVGEKAKLTAGSFEEKAKAIANFAVIFTKVVNYKRHFQHLKSQLSVADKLQQALHELKDSGNASEKQIFPMLSVKIFGNGNVDIKFTENSISYLIESMN